MYFFDLNLQKAGRYREVAGPDYCNGLIGFLPLRARNQLLVPTVAKQILRIINKITLFLFLHF